MTKLEELKAALAAHPEEWKACREHEEYEGSVFELDEDEEVEFETHPFVRILTPTGNVCTNHDLFEFEPGVAELIVLMKNTLPALIECAEAMLALGDAFDIGQRAGDTSAIGKYRKALAKLKEPS